MKSQGLPMTTVVLIIIVLLVLAVVAFFFFTYFNKSEQGVSAFTCMQLCQTEKAKYQDTKQTPSSDSQYCNEGCEEVYSCYYTETDSIGC